MGMGVAESRAHPIYDHNSVAGLVSPLRDICLIEYIEDYIQHYRKSPLYREIADALNIPLTVVRHYISQLVEDKKIHKSPSSHNRCLRLGENKIKQLKF